MPRCRCAISTFRAEAIRHDAAIDPGHGRRRVYRQPRLQGSGARRLPARSSTTICRAGIARRCAGGRSSRAISPTARTLAATLRGASGRRRSCISPPSPMSASWSPSRRSITATIVGGSTVAARRDARGRGGRHRLFLDLRHLRRSRDGCRSPRRRRSCRSTPMARPSWRSSGRCTGTARPTACARWRCAISTPPAPIPTARSARCTSRRRISIPLVLQAALRQRPAIDVYGTDYPTPDGNADPRLHPCPGSGRRACARARSICAPAATARRSTSGPAAAIRCAR